MATVTNRETSSGHPPEPLVLGLDVGGTKLAAGVVAADGTVLSHLRTASNVGDGPDRMIARHLELGRQAVREAGLSWDRISAVRTGSIVRIDDAIASRWGPRLVSFFRAMSSALARLQ